MDNQLQERFQPPVKTSSVWSRLRKTTPKREQKNKQKKQHTFPFLALPLELRIMVYDHAISDQEHNITKRRHGYRLPGLFHTHPQITSEIYQFCRITTILNVSVPVLRSIRSIYNPTKIFHVFFTVFKLHMASKAVREFRKVEGGGHLNMKVKIRCLSWKKKKCRGLRLGDPCPECVVFENSWNSIDAGKEDMWAPDLFVFC